MVDGLRRGRRPAGAGTPRAGHGGAPGGVRAWPSCRPEPRVDLSLGLVWT
jgi:hypothetical protein